MPLYGSGVSQSDLATAISNNLAAMAMLIPAVPAAATNVPPGIGVTGATGNSSNSYARADHTHASSVQRTRLAVAANGVVTWTYTNPYPVPPIVNCTVENPAGATQPYVAVLVGQPTTASATFAVYKAQPTTLGSTLSALIGLVITPFAAAPSGLILDCWAALPTA